LSTTFLVILFFIAKTGPDGPCRRDQGVVERHGPWAAGCGLQSEARAEMQWSEVLVHVQVYQAESSGKTFVFID
jgi:hypothetical protein